MAIEVELPDGSIAEFPDDMPQDQIAAVLKKQFPAPQQAQPEALPGGSARPAAVASQSVMEGAADTVDAVLNTPNRLANLAKAAIGAPIMAAGQYFDSPGTRQFVRDYLEPSPDRPFARNTLAGIVGLTGGNMQDYAPQTQGEQRLATVGSVVGGAAVGGIRPQAPVRDLLSAIGAGSGMQIARETSPGNPLAELVGSAIGGASPAAFEGLARGTAGTARATAEPFTKTGQERIVGRALRQAEAVPGSIVSAQPSAVPGVQRTLAEATADPGIAQFQRATANIDQPSASAIDTARRQSNAARVEALRKIAGDDAALTAAQQARDKSALKFLRSAVGSENRVDTARSISLIDDMLAGRAGQREAVAKALTDVKTKIKQAAGETGGQAGVDIMYGIRQHIDDLISGKVGGEQQGAPLARRYLTTIKKVVDREIVKAAPSFRKYLDVYKQGSIPANQMQLGRELLDAATGNVRDPVTGELSITPNRMGAAVENMDRLAQRATGFSKAQAANILTPEQQSSISAVNQDLSRQAFADAAGRQMGSPTAQNLAGMNVLKQSLGPGGLGLPDAVVNSTAFTNLIGNPANIAYKLTGAPEQIMVIVRDVLTNPAEAQRIVSALPRQQRNQVAATIVQAMRQQVPIQAGQNNGQ